MTTVAGALAMARAAVAVAPRDINGDIIWTGPRWWRPGPKVTGARFAAACCLATMASAPRAGGCDLGRCGSPGLLPPLGALPGPLRGRLGAVEFDAVMATAWAVVITARLSG